MKVVSNRNGQDVTAAVIDVPPLTEIMVNWGDGSAVESQTSGVLPDARTLTFVHTYAGEGVYTVTATDGEQGAQTTISTVDVTADAAEAQANGRIVVAAGAPPLDGDRYTVTGGA